MEDADLRCLEIEQNFLDISKILSRFVQNNAQTFTFDSLNKNGKRQRLFNVIFKLLANPEAHQCHKECLESLRILSRETTGLNEALDESKIAVLLRLSSIYKAEEAIKKINESNKNDLIVAALKCLCNLVHNSTEAASYVSHSHAAEGILMRLRMYREAKISSNIKLFDIKLLFLMTALSPEIGPKLKHELHGLVYLIEALDLILKESPPKNNDSHFVKLSDNDVDLCCEILKVIFNLMAKSGGSGMANVPLVDEDEEETLCVRLTSTLHDLLLSETSPAKENELKNHTVNLLTSIPINCYSEVMTAATENTPKELEWEGKNMEAVDVMLKFLDHKLSALGNQQKSKSQQELLSPILTVMLQMSRHQRIIRKFLRHKILPPLRDVMKRPEEGDSMRAKLCRLLTSPSSTVKDLAAEFLYTLCKENVNRMIKYTGYGNAAGLFANRGIMYGNRSNSSQSSYSSDSDSETEEYAKYSDQINPVIGCYEPPRPHSMEGMTEEQKEYEAVKLANMLDKLSREGVFQPCQIGEDGRPQPVEHILQLQENLSSQQIKTTKK